VKALQDVSKLEQNTVELNEMMDTQMAPQMVLTQAQFENLHFLELFLLFRRTACSMLYIFKSVNFNVFGMNNEDISIIEGNTCTDVLAFRARYRFINLGLRPS
jgi:hypothetical protein